MSERSIAEIIGWRWHSRGRMWVPPELDNGLDSLTRPVTVDDMLAWLRTTDRFLSIVAVDGNDTVVVTLKRPGSSWRRCRPIRLATMREALEYAIREVDDQLRATRAGEWSTRTVRPRQPPPSGPLANETPP